MAKVQSGTKAVRGAGGPLARSWVVLLKARTGVSGALQYLMAVAKLV